MELGVADTITLYHELFFRRMGHLKD